MGKSIFSMLMGLIISMIVGKMLFNRVEYHGPNSKNIIGKTFYDPKTDAHYQYTPEFYICRN